MVKYQLSRKCIAVETKHSLVIVKRFLAPLASCPTVKDNGETLYIYHDGEAIDYLKLKKYEDRVYITDWETNITTMIDFTSEQVAQYVE